MMMSDQTENNPIQRLQGNISRFTDVIRALPEAVFLHRFTEWAPRDVVAHLIGWNYLTREGIAGIRQGISPAYIEDYPNNFATANAASVATYAATERNVLLAELQRSADLLLADLHRLAPADWMHDFGARNPIGRPVFIQRQVDGLSDDYLAHAQEVEAWANSPSPGV
jgi:hypothetical protein